MKKNLDIANKFCQSLGPSLYRGSTVYCFQLPKLNKYCLRIELAPAHQVIKKLEMDHLWVYTLYPTSCRNGYRM